MTPFKQQLWVVTKIWIIAVLINTILGTCILGMGEDLSIMGLLLLYGFVMGGLFSLPVAIILLLIIYFIVSRFNTGIWLFWIVLASGIALTIATFSAFSLWIDGALLFSNGLLAAALFAGSTAIFTQYNTLIKIGKEPNYEEEFSF